MPEFYRLWINDERTVLVRIWPDGQAEMATRPAPEYTWGPPVSLQEEGVRHVTRQDLEVLADCLAAGCPGGGLDHTGKSVIDCGLERGSEECEA